VAAAVGCPDFTLPSKAELKREGDRVTVTCEDDRRRSWQRRCVGTQWEGELGTCPAATGAVSEPPGPLPLGECRRQSVCTSRVVFTRARGY